MVASQAKARTTASNQGAENQTDHHLTCLTGLAENVREGYDFIATNYEVGDEIFFFGFSRGAFTARAIAGLIGEIGVLTKQGMPFLAEIFKDVQHRHDSDYESKHPDIPFRNKPSALDPRYRKELARRGLTVLDVPIKAIGVWDTVGMCILSSSVL